MFQIISVAQKKSSLSELFGSSGNQMTSFSFGSSIQKYILYVFIGIIVLVLIKAAVKAIRSTSGQKEVTDSPYRLRKLSTRLEHIKKIVSEKKSFTYRFFYKKEKKHETWRGGKFLSMDKKRNLIVVLYAAVGKPAEHINKILEIKYPVGKNNGIVRCSISKYLGSKKTSKNTIIRMYELLMPLVVKLEPKRKDIRFNASPDYPIRVYILPDKLDIPVATDCIDFSGGGMLVDLKDAKAGCLDYLMKKDKIITEKELDEEQAEKLTLYKVLSQPELRFGEARKTKQKIEPQLEEYSSSIEMSKKFISSLNKDDTVKLFFVLPELALMEEAAEELLSADNRTIMCDAIVNNKAVAEKTGEYRVALNFLDMDNMARDIIHQYGMESWRE